MQIIILNHCSIKGTWVNGTKLPKDVELELNQGDEISFRQENGDKEIKFIVHLPTLRKRVLVSDKEILGIALQNH